MGPLHVYLFPLLVIAALFYFFGCYVYSVRQTDLTLALRDARRRKTERTRLRFPTSRFPMERKDLLPMLLLTVVYAVTAFWGLGDTKAVQSFCTFSDVKHIQLELNQPRQISRVMYYCGLNTGGYFLECSVDGVNWTPVAVMEQTYVDLFKWREVDIENDWGGAVEAHYLRISSNEKEQELGELAIYDVTGDLLNAEDFSVFPGELSALMDEQELVPERPTHQNSTYFDEIYHARTAYEHIRNVYPYEISHPPLGKLILGIGIQLFGMTPFGWRFMGTLFGVLMLPVLYVFFKNLFGKTPVAFCGTALFAFDFMHLTQTRIATIDTYAVFFILLMYYFMYRFLTTPTSAPFYKAAIQLVLSGLFFGIGVASKWTVLYGGVGLAVLLLISLILRYREAKLEDVHGIAFDAEGNVIPAEKKENVRRACGRWIIGVLLVCVGAFVVVPVIIYCLSYLPYAAAKGEPLNFQLIWDNQVFMFTYHKGVTQEHPYASKWWQWIFDIRPILYYLDSESSMKTAFGAFSNPVVCWGGLLSMLLLVWRLIKTKAGIALFILIGYLSQLVFWIPISRPTFAYHYFPSILFLTFAITYVCNELWEAKQGKCKGAIYGITGGAVFLYAAFYPVLTGITVPTWYGTNFLKWFPSWPF